MFLYSALHVATAAQPRFNGYNLALCCATGSTRAQRSNDVIAETSHAHVRLPMRFLWSPVGSHSEDQRRAVGRLPCLPAPELKKMLSMPGFRLSGSGWYETDFKTGAKKNLAGGDKAD